MNDDNHNLELDQIQKSKIKSLGSERPHNIRNKTGDNVSNL